MTSRRSKSIRVGPGDRCPNDGAVMDRFEHEKGFKPRDGQPYYFRHWDRCSCGHLQHYEDAKVFCGTAPKFGGQSRPLNQDQARAAAALRAKLPNATSKKRRRWLAEKMGIEDRYASIADFDAVECATVLEICGEQMDSKHA